MSCEICMFFPYVWRILAFWLSRSPHKLMTSIGHYFHHSTTVAHMTLECIHHDYTGDLKTLS